LMRDRKCLSGPEGKEQLTGGKGEGERNYVRGKKKSLVCALLVLLDSFMVLSEGGGDKLGWSKGN